MFITCLTEKIDNCINIIKNQKSNTDNPIFENDNTNVYSDEDSENDSNGHTEILALTESQ